MDNSLIIERLRKIEDDARSLRLEIERASSTAPEDFKTEPPARVAGNRQFKVTPPSAIRDPLAKSPADMVTPKQLGMIRALGREKGVDHELECQQLFNCTSDELSKRAASSLIDHLTAIQPEFTARRA